MSITCYTLGPATICMGILFISPTESLSIGRGIGVIPKALHISKGMMLDEALESSRQLCRFLPNILIVVKKGGVSNFPRNSLTETST